LSINVGVEIRNIEDYKDNWKLIGKMM
jgi:hypothetical protein